MKKVFLSVFVIVTFSAYAIHQHLTNSDKTAVVPQTSVTTATVTPRETQTTFPSSAPPQPTNIPLQRGNYTDGSYTGNSADAFYGNIQVKAIISGGKITDVQFLDYPQDRGTSVRINTEAMPYLKQEAIQAQSANVDIVSGATQSSRAFIESLTSALSQAK